VKRVDWAKPAYAVYATRTEPRGYFASRLLCDLCGRKVAVGDRWARGPRGEKGVHASCRDELIAERTGVTVEPDAVGA
jgi:hypothetical protein